MHNDALPFTLVVFFVIFFFLMLAPMFYAVVMGVREKNLQMERERLVQLYGFDFERIRQDEPLLMEHIHRLIPMIGIVPTIRYVSSAAGLPIDVAQILVCSEPAAPLTSSPYPMAHPGSAAPQVGTRPSYPMSSRPGTTQFQPDEASASDSATREASATRAPPQFSASSAWASLPTSSVFSCGRRPISSAADASRHTRRHTGTRSFTNSLVPRYARRTEIGRKPPASCAT